jgi:muconolactone D-isomerase
MACRVQIEIARLAPQRRDELVAAEAARGRELRAAGAIVRIWRIPGRTANAGIWSTPDATALHEALTSLPLFAWMSVHVTPLAVHPLEAGDAGRPRTDQ